jgi:hypothetical protein
VSIYSLSEDEFADNTYSYFFEKASAISGNYSLRTVPWPVDWLHSFLKLRTFPLRHPLGRMMFSSQKLHAAGYSPRFEMAHAYQLAFDQLRLRAGAG